MSVRFIDYYETLGVPRDATKDAIRSAYRKLARKHHPDVDKTPGATERFQRINEAYEVLKDPAKRERYDRLGANWKAGDEFTPPAGQGGVRFEGDPNAFFEFGGDGAEGFSSFFEQMFGRAQSPFGRHQQRRGRRTGGFDFSNVAQEPRDQHATLTVDLEDIARGATRRVTLTTPEGSTRTYDVRIPTGLTRGSTIRLAGQAPDGGDLLLKLDVAPHPHFRVDEHDLFAQLRIAPWEAALGAKISMRGPDGVELVLAVPAGTSSGRKLRMRNQGLSRRDGSRGDLIVELAIAVQPAPTEEERRAYEELARVSKFDPRSS